MTDAWGNAQQLADKHAATGKYCRLENDGDAVVVAFLGEPYAREVVWDEAKQKYFPAKEGDRSNLRVSINVYNIKTKTVQIFEQGVTWFRLLLGVREKYGLDKWSFEIKRSGAKGNQKTTYTIFPEEQLDEAMQKDLKKLELFNLKQEAEAGDSGEETKSNGASSSSESGGTIDPDISTKLVGKLKELPAEAVKDFLAHFGVGKIRDVPKAKEVEAVSYVDSLVTKHKPPAPSAGAEIDPFS